MDFFRGIGNFFKGAFNGDDDEERKRKQREQARRTQQNTLKVQKNTQQPTLEMGKAQPQQKLEVAKVQQPKLQLQKPTTVAPPRVVTPSAPQQVKNVASNVGSAIKQTAEYAKDNKKEFAREFARDVAQAPFRAGASIAKTAGSDDDFQSNAFRRFFFGREKINKFNEAGQEAANLTLSSDQLKKGDQANINPVLAAALGGLFVASDLTPLGGAKKKVLKGAIKSPDTPNTPRSDVKPFGGKADELTESRINDLIKQSEEVPVAPGKVRVFQSDAPNGKTNWVFTDVDSLRMYKSNTTAETDTFKFLDVPKEALKDTARGDNVKEIDPSILQKQADEVAQAADNRADTNQQIADDRNQAAQFQNGAPVLPPQITDEVLANDVYASQYKDTFDMTDEALRLAGVDTGKGLTKESGVKKFFAKATGGIISDPYKGMVDKIQDALADKAYGVTVGGNIFSQAPARIATLFASNAVLKDSLRQVLRIRNDAQQAAGDSVKRLHDNISDQAKQLDMPPEQFNQVLDQVFETPDFLARKYGDNVPNIDIDQLPPQIRGMVDQLIAANKMRNLALFKQGRISLEEYKLFENGMHSPRLYDFEKQNFGMRGNKLIDNTSTKKRNKLEDISDEAFDKLIDSPAQRMLIRLEMAMRSQASHDALKALDEAGMLLNEAPNNQFSRLEGAKWGNYQGKVVYNPIRGQLEDAIIANTDTGQKASDLLDKYRESGFGKADRFFKKTKTVYSPGTFVGNVASNPLFFNRGAGVNPIGQSARMAKAGVDLIAHRTGRNFNADIYEAQKYGVFSSDTGKQITGENNPQLTVSKNKKINPFESAYGGADDAAKLAIWRTLRGQGVAPELAARRVSQFTQDYNNAGRLIRALADTPVLGSPFARFAPELVRLTKNNLLYNPVGMVAGVGLIALIQNELSEQAEETPEEREARETGMGQTLIPGTGWLNMLLTGTNRDVSLNFPVGDTAINVARATGLNFPIDESGDPRISLIKSLAPWAIPTRENAQGDMVFAPEELFSSLALSPIAQQIANRDFMGRQITDPENRIRYEQGGQILDSQYENPDGTRQSPGKQEETINRLKQLFMAYAPLANETTAVGSALLDRKDYYGKERTVPEAIARMFGFKTESNTQEVQEGRVETQQYFDEDLPAVQNFLRENPDLTDAYLKLKNTSRDRGTDISTNDLVTPEKWDIINSDTSGRLFGFMKDQAVKQLEQDGKPLDPVFQLPPEQAKYVSELRSRPSGDDIEAQEILRATSNWYAAYEDRYYEYLDKNSEYFNSLPEFTGGAKKNPRVEAYGEASAPVEQPEIIKEYYRIKAENPEYAKEVYKNNKEMLSAAFDSYAVDRLDRINKLRKIEGYEPISLETFKNDTFGFDAGSSYGFGGGGGGGGGGRDTNTLGQLTNFSADIKALDSIEAQAMPDLQRLLLALQAGRSGGRAKPPIGASSRGQG